MSNAGGGTTLSAVAVIPARFASTRLPGKPLLEVAGAPLIEHVWRRASRAGRVSRVLVVTDDRRILSAVRSFGGEARLTSSEHPTGSDRIGEVLDELPEEVVLNVQGDEPEVDPDLLDRLIRRLEEDERLAAVTAAAPITTSELLQDPNAVKVVLDVGQRALYFSRSPIPGSRPGAAQAPPAALLHLGLYAYRREALRRFLSLPQGRLERQEGLEQLRLLENGMSIGVVLVEQAHQGIDTPEDFEAFRARMEGGP